MVYLNLSSHTLFARGTQTTFCFQRNIFHPIFFFNFYFIGSTIWQYIYPFKELLTVCNKVPQLYWFMSSLYSSFDDVLSLKTKYIHNWSLQRFNQVYDLASHTTYVVYINFIHEWQDSQSTPNDWFLKSFSWQFYLLSEFFPKFCWDEFAEGIFLCLCVDVWPGVSTRLIS